MRFTVFGSGGFLGSHIVRELYLDGHDLILPRRDEVWPPSGRLGHVIYAVGVTGDFTHRPVDTMTAHIGRLGSLLSAGLDSFLYLSSTRVYDGALLGDEEAVLSLQPSLPDHLYNASKIAGEALCLSDPRDEVRVVRLSHVYGLPFAGPNFLEILVNAARARSTITIKEAPTSARDFVDVRDVARLIPLIATIGSRRLYNVASGSAVTTRRVVELLLPLGLQVRWCSEGPVLREFPHISISRIRTEFSFTPRSIEQELPLLLSSLGGVS